MAGRLILASASPRRSELLTRMGLTFEIDPAKGEENASGTGEEVVLALARQKAEEVSARHPDDVVLAADTVVCLGSEILGKPADEADARRMLRMLSDHWHEVYTGVCVISGGKTDVRAACTRVHFIRLSEQDITEYLKRGEAMDKAGAYGIQGAAGMMIDRIEGCPHNVMGLPLAMAREMLRAGGI